MTKKQKQKHATPKATGQGPIKRTPKSYYEQDTKDETWEIDQILAETAPGVAIPKWFIHWKGWDAKFDSWEPLENLAGCEEVIRQFKETNPEHIAAAKAAADARELEARGKLQVHHFSNIILVFLSPALSCLLIVLKYKFDN